MLQQNPQGVSIVICTYNGKKNLGPTLEHLARQKQISDIKVELLVIDNASTDGTSEFAAKHWQILNSPFDLRIVSEIKPGKGNASVTGFNASTNSFILVCDDDNWLHEDYLRKAYDVMIQNPQIGALGGKGEAVFETTEPNWFKKNEHIFAVGKQFSKSGKQHGYLWGAGMVFRKEIWDNLTQLEYAFFLNEKREGNLNWGGDDSELCAMVTLMGYDIYYDDALSYQHYIPAKRASTDYLTSRYFGLGRSRIYVQAYDYCKTHHHPPGEHLKYPLWIDRYIHQTKLRLSMLPKVLFKQQEEANPEVLQYIALKGELYELWRIKNGYSDIFKKILAFKKAIENLSL